MEKINFVKEITHHVICVIKLRCFLEGGECLTQEQAVAYKTCGLGKWLYGEGLKQYGSITQMQELVTVHRDMHTLVGKIVILKQNGEYELAQKELEHLQLLNEKIILLIGEIEEKIGVTLVTKEESDGEKDLWV